MVGGAYVRLVTLASLLLLLPLMFSIQHPKSIQARLFSVETIRLSLRPSDTKRSLETPRRTCTDVVRGSIRQATATSTAVHTPSIVVMVTSSQHTAVILANCLADLGVSHHLMGETSLPSQQFNQHGNGTALILVASSPFGLPHNLPVVYVIGNPVEKAACLLLEDPDIANSDLTSVMQLVNAFADSWVKETRDWFIFRQQHQAPFNIISTDALMTDQSLFNDHLLNCLGLKYTDLVNKSHAANPQQAHTSLSSALEPQLGRVCSALDDLHKLNLSPGELFRCYTSACTPVHGHGAHSPSCGKLFNETFQRQGTPSDATFEDPRFGALVKDSPKQFILTKRRVCLLTSYYGARSEARRTELELALRANVQNPYIDEVHVFINPADDGVQLDNIWVREKLFVIQSPHQPTHKDAIIYANVHLAGNIVIFSNSDIVFTATIHFANRLGPGQMWALSRHVADTPDYFHGGPGAYVPRENKCHHYPGSHDSFMFLPPVSEDIANSLGHVQSLWGSENVVIHEFQKAGWQVSNPCKSIVTFHVHVSSERPENRERINQDRSGVASPSELQACAPQGSSKCERNCWAYSTQDGMLRDVEC